ncbi:MAG: S41 family peptidase [Planctomycetota bacterium]
MRSAAALLFALLPLVAPACISPRAGDPWVGEFRSEDPTLGRQRVRLTLTAEEGEPLAGGSRYRALSDLTGSFFVGLYERFHPDHGALLSIDASDAAVSGEALALDVATPVGPLRLEGLWEPGRFEGRWEGGGVAGRFAWRPDPAPDEPLDDYPAVLEGLLAALDEHFVFPARLAEDEWLEAVADARERVALVRDDFELVGLTTLLLEPLAPSTLCLRQAAKPESAEVDVSWRGEVCVVDFGAIVKGLDDIDAALEEALDAEALIVDLRGSVGFDLTPARLLAWLAPASEPVGYMLGRKRADDGPLAPAARDALPLPSGLYSFGLYRTTLAVAGVAAGACESNEPEERFDGPVMVLVDGFTRAANEGLVEFLQRRGLATVVGEPTAGAALDAELYPLPGGWTAIVPVGTWVTWEGRWMEGNPVVPDVEVPSAEALEAALAALGGEDSVSP